MCAVGERGGGGGRGCWDGHIYTSNDIENLDVYKRSSSRNGSITTNDNDEGNSSKIDGKQQ